MACEEVPADLRDHPRYHIVERIGSGGMGTVFRAEHRLMERTVALKVISPDLAGSPDVIDRFRREVRAVAQLSHPNIVTAHDAEQVRETHFLVMEFVSGHDLARWVADKGRLDPQKACGLIRQAAVGLDYAFRHGHVHRDIKPQNLMVTPQGQLKILDFGLARVATEARAAEAPVERPVRAGSSDQTLVGFLTQAGIVLGTPDYIAPEQVADPRSADVRADIYSLGCTLYYLLSGHVPFPAGSVPEKLVAHTEGKAVPLAERLPGLNPAVVEVVARAMARSPDHRFQTPAEFAAALDRAISALEPVVPAVLVPMAAPARSRGFGRTLLGCLLILVVGIAGVAVAGYLVVTNVIHTAADVINEIGGREETWRLILNLFEPPAIDASDDVLFPDTVEGFSRTATDSDGVEIPELALSIDPGRHATYQNFTAIEVHLYVADVSKDVQDSIFTESSDREGNSSIRFRRSQEGGTMRRLVTSTTQPPFTCAVLCVGDRLFVAFTRSSEDEPDPEQFQIEYVKAVIQGRIPAEKSAP